MNISEWVSKCVKIDSKSGYYYKGKIISIDDDSILLKDFKGNNVMLKLNNIMLIKEVSNGN
jgi:small nuclear ribonucleoprotein (snRNP)-like protein